MDLLPLLISVAAGGMVAALVIFWLVVRSVPHTAGGAVRQFPRQTDNVLPMDVRLVTQDEERVLH